MLKTLTIIGTRPEAIKMAPVIQALNAYPNMIESQVCLTGQHREMLDNVLDLFDIQPDIDLNLMQPNQSLARLTSSVVNEIDKVIGDVKPDLVLVQGDTTTVMAASIAAFYHGVEIGHVEAGLRSGNLYSPFPEELNRKVVGVIARYHFAPTLTAKQSLISEGTNPEHIHVTGNTSIDALFTCLDFEPSEDDNQLIRVARSQVPDELQPKIILMTAHRRENFGEPLENICQAIRQLVERNPDVVLIYPVHLNPKVKEPVYRLLGNVERIILCPPVSYQTLAYLIQHSYFVLTDSGGLQEEAPALGKPVLVLRNETERVEAIAFGTAKLVGTNISTIVTECEKLLHDGTTYQIMAKTGNPYGDGKAAARIVRTILGESVGEFCSQAEESSHSNILNHSITQT